MLNLITKSFQMQTFGLKKSQLDNETSIRNMIKHIDEMYSLVIINEYFDESLLLLRRKFCWDIKDIIYIPLRARHYQGKNKKLDEHLKKIHEDRSKADYTLYEYFKRKLEKQIKIEPYFSYELENYQQILKEVTSFCEIIQSFLKQNYTRIYDLAISNASLSLNLKFW